MFRRLGAVLLVVEILAGCGGSSAPSPAGGGYAAATPAPTSGGAAATVAAGGSAGQAQTITVTLDGKAKTYPATCTIAEGSNIKVEGTDGSDSASFVWNPGTMPEAAGVMDGVAWKAPDLNASISFASAHSWTFSGSDAETGKKVEGQAICN